MGHQIVITFDMDETRIQENAEQEAGRQIASAVLKSAFGADYYREHRMHQYVKEAIKEIMGDDRERIVNAAVKDLADALARTKFARERMMETVTAAEMEDADADQGA